MENKINFKVVEPVVGIIILAVLYRLFPHPPNFTPIAALALFSGANLKGMRRFMIPLIVMSVSDLFLGFHSTILYVYGSFIITSALGTLLQNNQTFLRIISIATISSLLFFIITNFGVWAGTTMYPKDLSGLLNAYVMGIPFFKNTLLGDLFYTITLFYGYKYNPILMSYALIRFKS